MTPFAISRTVGKRISREHFYESMKMILVAFIVLLALMTSAHCQQTAEDWYNKGYALFAQGKYDEAIPAYDEAIRLDPNYAEAWNGKGVALERQNMYNDAIQAYDKAIMLDPKFVVAWVNKGEALDRWDKVDNRWGKHDESIKAYDEAIRLDPMAVNESDGAYWYKQSVDLYEQSIYYPNNSKYYEALWACNKAIELDPHLVKAWINKAIILNQHSMLIDVLNEAIKENPKSEILRLALLITQSAYEGTPDYKDTFTSMQENFASLYLKGAILAENYEFNESIGFYNKAISLNPRLVGAWICKGVAFKMLYEYDEALKAFDEAIKIDPRNAMAWYNKGTLLERLAGCSGDCDYYLSDEDKVLKLVEANKAKEKAMEFDPQLWSMWQKGYNPDPTFLILLRDIDQPISCENCSSTLTPSPPGTTTYGLPRCLWYKDERAALLAAGGQNDDMTFYIITSKALVEDIYGMKTIGYDQDVLLKGLADGWLTIYVNPTIWANRTIQNKIQMAIRVIKTNETRPEGFYQCKIISYARRV